MSAPTESRALLLQTLEAVVGRPFADDVLPLALRRARMTELPKGAALSAFAYDHLLAATVDVAGLLAGIRLLRAFTPRRTSLRFVTV
ncbi:MAG: hypothetical protein IPJ34_21205 [Myxococcales bacterium]|nr:hypothetical protein [Myxococcales bacterium]